VAAVLAVCVLAVFTVTAIRRDGTGPPGERALPAYQARISDKTVHPLASAPPAPWQPAAAMAGSQAGDAGTSAVPLFRKSIPREAAAVPTSPPGAR